MVSSMCFITTISKLLLHAYLLWKLLLSPLDTIHLLNEMSFVLRKSTFQFAADLTLWGDPENSILHDTKYQHLLWFTIRLEY